MVFHPPVVISFDDNPATNVTAPSNVPPTTPGIANLPEGAAADEDLLCAIETPSYDLDAVKYRIRWYRDGVFAKELGEKPVVPAAFLLQGEVWTCRVRATDGVEWSPQVEISVTITEPGEDG